MVVPGWMTSPVHRNRCRTLKSVEVLKAHPSSETAFFPASNTSGLTPLLSVLAL
jgi:hypothetical protein